MKKSILSLMLLLLGFATYPASAHVPYLENSDYSLIRPFKVVDSVENSKVIYSWLRSRNDVDVYTFEVTEPVRVLANSVVPVCPAYEDFLPWIAVVGPGLPAPEEELPFEIPDGYGAVVVKHEGSNETLEQFCEPEGGKYYYLGPLFDQTVSQAGTWYIFYWDPEQRRGDYIANIGFREFKFEELSLADQLRTIVYTLIARLNLELHVPCPQFDLPPCPTD